ncbi:MAG: class I SAM-dependent methyltransferase [Syntrophales bacterium]|nr:class I SAM-dependent methyltransferase [Syntrophales bacterium]
MVTHELLDILKRMEPISSASLLKELSSRKLKELEFHNRDRDMEYTKKLSQDTYEKLHGNKKFYSTVQLSREYNDNWIAEKCPGKVVLDYACGNGIIAIKVAKAGAALAIGLDISDVSIQNCRDSAIKQGVNTTSCFVQGDCENTGLPSDSIDIIICSGMLHHLDLSFAFYEMRRVLKPGGVILVNEALDYNPLIKLYRNRTPDMRTEWEKAHILSYKDVQFAERFFDVQNIRHWHLFSIAGVWMPGALTFLNSIDRIVLEIPGLKKLSWIFTFELHKRREY